MFVCQVVWGKSCGEGFFPRMKEGELTNDKNGLLVGDSKKRWLKMAFVSLHVTVFSVYLSALVYFYCKYSFNA